MHSRCAVFLVRGQAVLLGQHLNEELIGPPSDRIGPLETAQDAAGRIVRELTGFDVTPDYWPAGIVVTILPDKSYQTLHVFTTTDFILMSRPRPVAGFVNHWVALNELPYDQMAPGSHLWVPEALKNAAFRVQITLDAEGNLADYRTLA